MISSGDQLVYVIVFVLLLIGSALISGAEVAFFSLSTTELDNENEEFPRRSLIKKLLDRPKKLLATILIANNTINITSILIFGILSDNWFSNMEPIAVDFGVQFHLDIRFVLDVVVVTFLILLFGLSNVF